MKNDSQKPETLSTFQFFQRFPDEETARQYFEKNRWGGEAHCGHCGSTNVVECKNHKPMPYRCRDCRSHFSVRTGTVLAESRLPLQKWLLAIFMLTSARKGIPSTQMARELGVTQKTAWFLAQRIRETWASGNSNDMGPNTQVDETYMGGKEKNKHGSKKLHAGRGAVAKAVVGGGAKELPVAIYSGILPIGDIELDCAVLENGDRVLSERAVHRAFGSKRGGSHWKRMKLNGAGANLPSFLSAKNLEPFISDAAASSHHMSAA